MSRIVVFFGSICARDLYFLFARMDRRDLRTYHGLEVHTSVYCLYICWAAVPFTPPLMPPNCLFHRQRGGGGG